jgi:hypothetical protein
VGMKRKLNAQPARELAFFFQRFGNVF